jgi:phosphopantetheinyl transferase
LRASLKYQLILANLDKQNLQKLNKNLIESDLSYIAKMNSDKRSAEFTVGRAVLRLMLLKLGYDSKAEILKLDNGKPYLKNGPSFSISHSHNLIGVLIGDKDPVGLDIQFKDQSKNLLKIVQEKASNDELKQFKKLSEQEQVDSFYERWASIEANAKVFGHGLAKSFRGVDPKILVISELDYAIAIASQQPSLKLADIAITRFIES